MSKYCALNKVRNYNLFCFMNEREDKMKNKGRYWGFLVISLLCLIIDLVSWFTMDSSVSLVDSNMLIIYFTAIISAIVLIRCLVKIRKKS